MMIFSIEGAVERNVKSTNTASSDGSKHVLDLVRIDGGRRVECSKAEKKEQCVSAAVDIDSYEV